MAAGVCASTSFRLLMRCTRDYTHYTRRSMGLRIMPISTIGANSWCFGGRQSYCTNKSEDLNSGNTTTATSASPIVIHKKKKASSIAATTATSEKTVNNSSISDELNLTELNLKQTKLTELKSLCRSYGLKANGKKSVLIKRLQDYLEQQQQPQQQQELQPLEYKNKIESKAPEVQQSSVTNSMSTTLLIPTPSPQIHDTYDTTSDVLRPPEVCQDVVERQKSHSSSSQCDTHTVNDLNDDYDVNVTHNNSGDVSVEYIHGLPHLTIPLPSRNEKCRFALKPVSHRVGDLIDMLKTEDRGIDRATILNTNGVRIASTCNIESLMDEPFWIHINDQKYKVVPPKRERMQAEDLKKLDDIKALVSQLYEALHVGEYHIQKELELTTKLEDLKYKISPLEREKSELSAQAERKTNIMTWVGLGLMSVQFGILARLTWWEYSWDIMEPVTYFVTYGTAMAMYAYYCITKTEYNMPEVKDRHYLITLYKRAKKKNFDVDTYNQLKRQIAEIEYDLRRLRDPLNLQLPPHVDRSQQNPPLNAVPPAPSASEVSPATVKKSGFKIPFLDSKN